MKKSVLVIDNDLNTCRELKSALEDEETEVYYVPSPNEALRVFMKWSFCLVIMDTQLPECNGCEVLRMMRPAKAIPILVLSAKVDVAKRTEILRAGANVYLEKPYDLEELLAQVRSLIALCTASIPLENQHYTLGHRLHLDSEPVSDGPSDCQGHIAIGEAIPAAVSAGQHVSGNGAPDEGPNPLGIVIHAPRHLRVCDSRNVFGDGNGHVIVLDTAHPESVRASELATKLHIGGDKLGGPVGGRVAGDADDDIANIPRVVELRDTRVLVGQVSY